MDTSPWIVDVDLNNFEQVCVVGSNERPVLIDFWATWCGPCKALTPILEKVARDQDGAFLLAKVDVDKNPDLAAAFRVQSVPTVVLLKDSRPVTGFMGAKSEAEVLAFLAEHAGTADEGDVVQVALDMERDGQRAEAIETLTEVLANEPEFTAARIELARMLLDEGRDEEARGVFARVTGDDLEDPAARKVAERLAGSVDPGELEALAAKVEASPKDVGLRVAYGKALFAAGRHEDGLQEMYEGALRDVHYNDGEPRKALVEAFATLGETHPLTLEFQQQLSILICS